MFDIDSVGYIGLGVLLSLPAASWRLLQQTCLVKPDASHEFHLRVYRRFLGLA